MQDRTGILHQGPGDKLQEHLVECAGAESVGTNRDHGKRNAADESRYQSELIGSIKNYIGGRDG